MSTKGNSNDFRFVLYDGHSYLSRDSSYRYTLTTAKSRALKMSEKAARNLVNNSLKNNKMFAKKKWEIVPVDMTFVAEPVAVSETESEPEATIKKEVDSPGTVNIKDSPVKESTTSTDSSTSKEDLSETELLELLIDGLEAYCELETRRGIVADRLETETKLREDLEHTIENVRFNAFQGYDFCKRLQQISRDRRITKRNLLMMKAVFGGNTLIEIPRVKKVLEQLYNIRSQHNYYYRVMSEFGKSVQRDQTISQATSQATTRTVGQSDG